MLSPYSHFSCTTLAATTPAAAAAVAVGSAAGTAAAAAAAVFSVMVWCPAAGTDVVGTATTTNTRPTTALRAT